MWFVTERLKNRDKKKKGRFASTHTYTDTQTHGSPVTGSFRPLWAVFVPANRLKLGDF